MRKQVDTPIVKLRKKITRLVATLYGVRRRDIEILYGFRVGHPGYDWIRVEIDAERYLAVDFVVACFVGDTEKEALERLLRSVLLRCKRVTWEAAQ